MDRQAILEAVKRRMNRQPADELDDEAADIQANDPDLHERNMKAVQSLQQEESMPEGEVVPGSIESEFEENPHEGVRIHHETDRERQDLEDRIEERRMIEEEGMGDESSLRGKAMGDLARSRQGKQKLYG